MSSNDIIALILFVTLATTMIALGLFWAFVIHPQMLREEQQFNEFKREWNNRYRR